MKFFSKLRLVLANWALGIGGADSEIVSPSHSPFDLGALSGIGSIAPPAIVAEDGQRQLSTATRRRRGVLSTQSAYLNKLIEFHNIDLGNYMAGFIGAVSKEGPGGPVNSDGSFTSLGHLMMSLNDGSYVPNPELGEVELSEEQEDELDKLEFQRAQHQRSELKQWRVPTTDQP